MDPQKNDRESENKYFQKAISKSHFKKPFQKAISKKK